MKRTICILVVAFFSLCCLVQVKASNRVIVSDESVVCRHDSTAVQKRIIAWTDSLSNRNFSEDMATLRVKAEQLGDKTKETIEEHTPVVKELMQSIADYLKR